jgi:hypothetical protein
MIERFGHAGSSLTNMISLMMPCLRTLALVGWNFGAVLTAAGGESVVWEVAAGDHDRAGTPIALPLPEPLASSARLELLNLDRSTPLPVQRAEGAHGPEAVFLLDEPLARGQSRRYRLSEAPSGSASSPAITCSDDGHHIWLRIGDRPVLRYNHTVVEPPPGIAAVYRRSGYIHPLFSPAGKELTGDFAADHPHQHGLFMAWVNTQFEGRRLDFWNQGKQTGQVEHVGVRQTTEGPVFAELQVLRHLDPTAPGGPRPVLDETWTIRVYNRSDGFLFDLVSHQRCAGPSPLELEKYHYGGMALRGNGQWLTVAGSTPPCDYLTSEGFTRVDGNAQPARWVELHGRLDGQPAGVAVLGHPENFRAPQPARLHPTKPYFVFAPMIAGSFRIEPGDTYTSRYRYWLHDGPPDAGQNDRHWHDYATPPTARIVAPAP